MGRPYGSKICSERRHRGSRIRPLICLRLRWNRPMSPKRPISQDHCKESRWRGSSRMILQTTWRGSSRMILKPTSRGSSRMILKPTSRGSSRMILKPTSRGSSRMILKPTSREEDRQPEMQPRVHRKTSASAGIWPEVPQVRSRTRHSSKSGADVLTLGYPESDNKQPEAGVPGCPCRLARQVEGLLRAHRNPTSPRHGGRSHRNPTDEMAHSGTLVMRVKGTENSR